MINTFLLPWKQLAHSGGYWDARLPNGSIWITQNDRHRDITVGYHPAGQIEGQSSYQYQTLTADGQLRVPGSYTRAGTFQSITEAMLTVEQYLRAVDYQPTERRA